MGCSCLSSSEKNHQKGMLGRDVADDVKANDHITQCKRNKLIALKPKPAGLDPRFHSKKSIKKNRLLMGEYSKSVATLFLQPVQEISDPEVKVEE